MKIIKFAVLSALAGIVTGCSTQPPTPQVSLSDLPNCLDANYDETLRLFTIKNMMERSENPAKNPANQQCLITVSPRGRVASASQLAADRYTIYLSEGGQGGAGGALQNVLLGGGGGGGGGAGARETQATVYLTEGIYKLTIGAGGAGGHACMPHLGFGAGPGWNGSPSNVVRVATGEVVIGERGADTYARPARAQQERMAQAYDRLTGAQPGHGGFGPGMASGGAGGRPVIVNTFTNPGTSQAVLAEVGESKRTSGLAGAIVAPGFIADVRSGGAPGSTPAAVRDQNVEAGAGGGGGATSLAAGGAGGGETRDHKYVAPERGSLGSGGGGGEGTLTHCSAGARGGHGYIAFRRVGAPEASGRDLSGPRAKLTSMK